jgi:pyruvate-ferredoxin/flavodoxin oxidoreductase
VLLKKLSARLGEELVGCLINNPQQNDEEIARQRLLVAELNKKLATIADPEAANLRAASDFLVRKSIWSFGGDGWAYDIGFGGLDHALASGRDLNILVLDTEVYSNTGGQASKATPRGAVAKFAAAGKSGNKKDLGMIAMSYGNVFVGSISLGANPLHTIKTIRAAESYRGPSLLIAFSHCIAWGIDMTGGMAHQKEAVACGYWPLYHYDPRDAAQPFHLDSKKPTGDFHEFAKKEARYAMLARTKPARSEMLMTQAQHDITARYQFYEQLAGVSRAVEENGGKGNGAGEAQSAKEVAS